VDFEGEISHYSKLCFFEQLLMFLLCQLVILIFLLFFAPSNLVLFLVYFLCM
jgi:hypothetical protein